MKGAFDYILTSDGSYTLYSKKYEQCYHNIGDGALSESLYKHAIPALDHAIALGKSKLNILDICFGLGYNTLASIFYVKQRGVEIKLNIYSPELDEELVANLVHFVYPQELEKYRCIVEAISKEQRFVSDMVVVNVEIADAREYITRFDECFFDIVYQDPFSTKKNPELWGDGYFAILSKRVAKNGVLTTYSKAKSTRDALLKNGFRLSNNENIGLKSSLIAYKISYD